ncbi:hypothetical protein BJ138DRAFT_1051993 [Hygrophoropsis aurantiaca]|uniref:Uncharacterized protein n=1 Tax=Hygrophoropsis aurantiaca TaxID=72124 RepID=A0ACB8ATU8_9AGAM|nr:hypothetical protein BJ138DRAFT_1051993 [Hygrophoropsis aurantiaca]
MSLTRSQLQRATTTLPWTRDFRHLLPVPKHLAERSSFYDPIAKAVRARDRIKYWNVVPGDQIRVRGDARGTIHEVLSINKFTNRVYLRGSVIDGNQNKMPVNRSVHYSKCQIYLGDMEHKAMKEGEQGKLVPTFARRVVVRDICWRPDLHRWDWKRLAAAITPNDSRGKKSSIPIDWPEVEPRDLPKTNPLLDTPAEAVREITYKAPMFPLPRKTRKKDASWLEPEDAYIKTLFNPSPVPYDESRPIELFVGKELANPHGRAKKQARWQNAQRRKVSLLKAFVNKELLHLGGRSVRDAKAEAAFKYRQKLEADRKAEKKRRWLTKDRLAKIARNVKRKERKVAKQKEKLNQLVLPNAPNQFIPGKTSKRS